MIFLCSNKPMENKDNSKLEVHLWPESALSPPSKFVALGMPSCGVPYQSMCIYIYTVYCNNAFNYAGVLQLFKLF